MQVERRNAGYYTHWRTRLARWRHFLGTRETRAASFLYLAARLAERLRLGPLAGWLAERLVRRRSFFSNPHVRWAYDFVGRRRFARGADPAREPEHARGPLALFANRALLAAETKAGQVESASHPDEVTFLMIDKCQAACHMCGGDYRASMTKRRITLDAYRTMLDHLRMDRVRLVTYGGGGEPLLNRDLVPIACHTAERHGHVPHAMITNAIALKPEVARRLLDAGLHFHVSMNAASRETYRRVFLTDLFEVVAKNVRELCRLRDERGSRSLVTLSTCVSRVNLADLPRLVELASEWGASSVLSIYTRFYPESFRFKKFTRPEDDLGDHDSLFFHQEESDRVLAEARELARRRGITFDCEPAFGEPFATADFRSRPCHYAWDSLFVGYGGEAYFCPGGEVLFREQVEGGLYPVGNLLSEDIEEIRNSAFQKRLRRTVSGRAEEVPECQVCGNCIMWQGPRSRKSHLLDWSRLKGPGERPLTAAVPVTAR